VIKMMFKKSVGKLFITENILLDKKDIKIHSIHEKTSKSVVKTTYYTYYQIPLAIFISSSNLKSGNRTIPLIYCTEGTVVTSCLIYIYFWLDIKTK